ncbi:hypothetical protein [Mesorhizobium sp.]|uniref:hypothetical protein n=1 Tax=Mesorhizobium sp. TaxID=1871066 RepID=UPI0025D8B35B|nr:hypothetical protein [Mesorhizobium sp.]
MKTITAFGDAFRRRFRAMLLGAVASTAALCLPHGASAQEDPVNVTFIIYTAPSDPF